MDDQTPPASEPGADAREEGGLSLEDWIEHRRAHPTAPRQQPARRSPLRRRMVTGAILVPLLAASGFLAWRWASNLDFMDGRNTTRFVVGLDDLEVGDCFTAYRAPEGRRDYRSGMVEVVVDKCSEPHELELVALLPVRSERFPTDRQWTQVAERCRQEYAAYSGTDPGSTEIETLLYTPHESDWPYREHKAWCLAATPIGEPRTSSLRGSTTG